MTRRLDLGIPQVVSVETLFGAMLLIAVAAIWDNDMWLFGAAFGLLLNAALLRVQEGLRR